MGLPRIFADFSHLLCPPWYSCSLPQLFRVFGIFTIGICCSARMLRSALTLKLSHSTSKIKRMFLHGFRLIWFSQTINKILNWSQSRASNTALLFRNNGIYYISIIRLHFNEVLTVVIFHHCYHTWCTHASENTFKAFFAITELLWQVAQYEKELFSV